MVGFLDKIKDLFDTDDEEYGYEEEDNFDEPEPKPYGSQPRKTYGLAAGTEALPKREPLREPLARERERERENVIPLRGREALQRFTEKFKIVVIEPKAFDECPKLVDSLKTRKPVIINLEHIENDTARKIFDFLSGATYALNGNVQKIAQNIFVFLPENVDVQSGSDTHAQGFKYGEDKADPWT
ncbi:MAG: cell division protein SepF [Clostridiales Family XIII bacterium]|jgi:cell division inhibitor SepF|nr:cell division protein SepF [Clostridiales Family XIII bacterium]